MNAIETKALTRRFGDKCAVDALEMTVRQGELFSLLGVNGAGKTTTIRLLSGLLRPTSGSALLFGLPPQSQEARRLFSLSPQETAVAGNLTVWENLELIAGIYDRSVACAARVCTALGLDVLARRELWHLIEGLKGSVTIILTTHYMEEAEHLSDRVGILADGRLRTCGTPAELMAQAQTDRFEEAFVRLAGGAQ